MAGRVVCVVHATAPVVLVACGQASGAVVGCAGCCGCCNGVYLVFYAIVAFEIVLRGAWVTKVIKDKEIN